MKINWKDFGLSSAIGLILYIFSITAITFYYDFVNTHVINILHLTSADIGLLTSALAIFSDYFLVFGIPLAFYFWRNKCELKEAAALSLIFGLTFKLLRIILYVTIMMFTAFTWLIPRVVDWPGLIFALILNGIWVVVYGSLIWFAINKLKWEKS